MTRKKIPILAFSLLLPLLTISALLFATHPEQLAYALRGNVLALNQAAVASNKIDAQLCYHDPQLQQIDTHSGNAGNGAFVVTLNYCPSQQAYFGHFFYLETSSPLTNGGCFYIQNDVTAHGGQSGFQLSCPGRIDPGDLTTAPNIDDGHPWQTCWIDYAKASPSPECTRLQVHQ